MGHRAVRGRWTRGHWRTHGLWIVVLITLGMIALPAAAAQADAVWTGKAASSQWSNATNWTGATPPTTNNTAAGTLSFPALGTCSTCYTSANNLTGITTTGLVFGNTAKGYALSGNSFTVGTGGITATAGGGAAVLFHQPIALSGPQTWVVGSSTNGYNSFTMLGTVTGPTTAAVGISTPRGDWFLDTNFEAGPLTSNGPGTLHIGGAPGSGHPGSINGTNGQSLTIKAGTLIPNPSSTSGPLTMSSGTTLLLGTNTTNTGTTTLGVNGAASLSSSTTTKTFVDANGTTAGTDFSQLRASGNITLGGKLILGQGASNGSCVALTSGDVATLVSTTGTLSGTFSNAPEGTVLTMGSSCQSTLPKLQIHYTSNSVTATVVGSASSTPTTTALATPNPSSPSTNQSVTLTATVSTSSVAPSGTVAFSANGSVISGCTSQPVVTSGSSGTATCLTSFAASSSPESLTAAFTPASGSNQASSTSSPQSLTVNKGSTTTTLAASDTSPAVGENVTYTATVAPGTTGTAKPSGNVAFQDGGTTISSCSAQALTGGTATCTVSYSSTGSHTITASYAGDGNFTGSSSSATNVTVQQGAVATTTSLATPNPSPSSTNQSVTLTATVSTSSVAPSGTVAFSANGSVISGCTSQPVTGSGSSGTATCSTSFVASSSPESLAAAFTPASGSGQTGSTSSPQTLTVNQASTTTTLAASDTSPAVGENVTYTATVAAGTTGTAKPSGNVAFQDGGTTISSCSAQALTGGTATCTVSYSSSGSHTITASYAGDGNFTGSSSSATNVTVQPGSTGTFPTTPILDTFAQSAGPLSSNWQSPGLQDAGTVSVATSGQTVSSSGAASAIWKATSFSATQEAYLTVPVLPAAGHNFQVGGRVSSLTGSSVSMYFLQLTPSKNLWDLRKKLNGASSTSMGTFTAPFAAGDSAGLQLNGSTITAWHESGGAWTAVGSVTDTSITAGGYVVFTLGDTTMRGGAFGGGNGS